jgi:hypothetical protein
VRSSGKDQVHAVLAKLGIPVNWSDRFGALRVAWLRRPPWSSPAEQARPAKHWQSAQATRRSCE